MNHNVEKLFGFPKVKWLHLTGEVDKSVKCSYQIFSGFYIPKIIRVGYFLIELFKTIKVDVFGGHIHRGKNIQ